MLHFANDGGMIPEQIRLRADPTHYGFHFGSGTGRSTPLVWSMARFMRLAFDAEDKRGDGQSAIVAEHFLKAETGFPAAGQAEARH